MKADDGRHRPVKTPDQLHAEIAYFERQKTQTRSRDRVTRAEAAIRTRVRQLETARKGRP